MSVYFILKKCIDRIPQVSLEIICDQGYLPHIDQFELFCEKSFVRISIKCELIQLLQSKREETCVE